MHLKKTKVHQRLDLDDCGDQSSRPPLLLRRRRQWHDDNTRQEQDSGTLEQRRRQWRSSGQDTADANADVDADTQNFDLRTGQVSATPLGAVIIATIGAPNAAALTIRCENSRRVDDDELCRVYLGDVFVDDTPPPHFGQCRKGLAQADVSNQ